MANTNVPFGGPAFLQGALYRKQEEEQAVDAQRRRRHEDLEYDELGVDVTRKRAELYDYIDERPVRKKQKKATARKTELDVEKAERDLDFYDEYGKDTRVAKSKSEKAEAETSVELQGVIKSAKRAGLKREEQENLLGMTTDKITNQVQLLDTVYNQATWDQALNALRTQHGMPLTEFTGNYNKDKSLLTKYKQTLAETTKYHETALIKQASDDIIRRAEYLFPDDPEQQKAYVKRQVEAKLKYYEAYSKYIEGGGKGGGNKIGTPRKISRNDFAMAGNSVENIPEIQEAFKGLGEEQQAFFTKDVAALAETIVQQFKSEGKIIDITTAHEMAAFHLMSGLKDNPEKGMFNLFTPSKIYDRGFMRQFETVQTQQEAVVDKADSKYNHLWSD